MLSKVCVTLIGISNRKYFSQSLAVPSSSIPPSLSEALVSHANAYAATHSIQIESNRRTHNDEDDDDNDTIKFETAPISLLPNAFPRSSFEQAQNLATSFNEMVDAMSQDVTFLTETLKDVGEADPFTGRLLKMYEHVYGSHNGEGPEGDEGKFAKMADRLGILRSDYMLNSNSEEENEYRLQQIELNTIASSFAGLATNVASMHQYLIDRFSTDQNDALNTFLNTNVQAIRSKSKSISNDNGVPSNPALQDLAKAMFLAHERYQSNFKPSSTPIILFIVQKDETNTIDQRLLEFKLWDSHQTPVVRLSLQDIPTATTFHSETGALILNSSGQEISLVYFRAGYAPTDYILNYDDNDTVHDNDDICWEGRHILEKSRATKCPNLGYHLCGTKKMQQCLARPGVLELFLTSKTKVDNIRAAFAGLYSLAEVDMEQNDYEAISRILKHGKEDEYVLKPQREGGGYNYYGQQLANKLRDNITLNDNGDIDTISADLAEFILMERIFPPHQNAILLRSGKIEGSGESISELGCFGCILSTCQGEIVHNKYSGFLLRTKFVGVNEGGVASGFATLSSPYLC